MSPYTKCRRYIEKATDPKTLYEDIRNILKGDERNYPEDHQIKTLQRLADAKHAELTAAEENAPTT